jgi:hypothetical protein
MVNHNSDGKPTQSKTYSWISNTVNAAGTAAATNITSITAFQDLFAPFAADGNRTPTRIKVTSSGAAYIKINDGSVITIGATTPFEATDLLVHSIGVSSGGSGVTVTVYLQ